MGNIGEKDISILTGNLKSGLSYFITTVALNSTYLNIITLPQSGIELVIRINILI